MLNIVIPLAGKSVFFESNEYPYPKPLIEINGKTMIETALEGFDRVEEPKRFIFVLSQEDCELYHLDRVVSLLTQGKCIVVRLPRPTKGAACSVLMAAEYFASADPMVISNGDQKLDADFSAVLKSFRMENLDAGVITFESVHPRWSYVRLDPSGSVIETAEKKPISKNAIAGFYYFARGTDFFRAATQMVEKDANVGGSFYVAPTLNELILQNMRLGTYAIPATKYHSFYSPKKIAEYES